MIRNIFIEDVLEFEPFNDFEQNYMHWFIPYMSDVFKNQSKRKIKDMKLHRSLVKDFMKQDNFEEMREIINALGRNGFKGPKTYFNPNKLFYEFLIENGIEKLSQINANVLKHYLSEELENYSYASKVNNYVAIKNFLSFIESKNYIKDDKAGSGHVFRLHKDVIKVIGKEKKKLAYLNPYDEFYKFLETIDKMPWRGQTKHRNRLALKILVLTGMRVGELIDIKKDDLIVSEKDNRLDFKIIGKGNKTRNISIAYELVKNDYNEYLANTNNNVFLFSTSTGKQLNDRYIYTLVNSTREAAGIAKKDKNGPHMLRHTTASYLSAVANFDIVKIQHFLDHEDITTTRKYLHLDQQVTEDVKNRTFELLGGVLVK
ncbi:tyrosine-type recombinase/integrase [Arcobacter vandammei]|uniref:tyrosine-type recombinase/integrase n=1 Tax=Arcobacter vandammei TaxID=2782243 RepID=UPI0018DFF77A|nr:tyrosine-type recombinase/integrase [Arcobacter vandammei]